MNEYLEREIKETNKTLLITLQSIQQTALNLAMDLNAGCPDVRRTNDLHSDLKRYYEMADAARSRLATLHDVHDSILENWEPAKPQMEESSGCVFNDLEVEKPSDEILEMADEDILEIEPIIAGDSVLERLENLLGGVRKRKQEIIAQHRANHGVIS